MRIVLMGPPGAGKSILAKKIAKHLNIPRIHLQDRLSSMADEETALGRLVGELITACAPIPEELISSALHEEIETAKEGFIIDDFPRDNNQAIQLDDFLKTVGAPLEVIIELHADNDDLMERLVGQQACDACGTQYNIYSNPPMVEGVCDMCGGRIARRPRDYEETVANRLRNCEVSISEMLHYFRLHNITHQVFGLGDDPAIFTKVKQILATVERIPIKEVEPEPVKKSVVSKKEAKEQSVKETVDKKEPATKKVAKKSASKKAVTKKATKKKVAKKAPVKKAPVKKAAKKKVAKKAASKKTAKKKVVKKAVTKKTVTKKKVAKKKVVKKAAKKKVVKKVAKKSAVKKAATKKRVAKKKAAKG